MLTNEQKESIMFYVKNDYLIINNLLYGNFDKLFSNSLRANEDNLGVMQEAEKMGVDKRWGVTIEDGKKIYDLYKKRTYAKQTQEVKDNIINQAIQDIKNIMHAMQPLEEDMILYRNINAKRFFTDYNENSTQKLYAFSSTSIYPHNESYHHEEEFAQIKLKIKKGTRVLRLDLMPNLQNEKDEILVAPIECKILEKHKLDNNCVGTIEMIATGEIPINYNNLIDSYNKYKHKHTNNLMK